MHKFIIADLHAVANPTSVGIEDMGWGVLKLRLLISP